jgi:hypothetical protein
VLGEFAHVASIDVFNRLVEQLQEMSRAGVKSLAIADDSIGAATSGTPDLARVARRARRVWVLPAVAVVYNLIDVCFNFWRT